MLLYTSQPIPNSVLYRIYMLSSVSLPFLHHLTKSYRCSSFTSQPSRTAVRQCYPLCNVSHQTWPSHFQYFSPSLFRSSSLPPSGRPVSWAGGDITTRRRSHLMGGRPPYPSYANASWYTIDSREEMNCTSISTNMLPPRTSTFGIRCRTTNDCGTDCLLTG